MPFFISGMGKVWVLTTDVAQGEPEACGAVSDEFWS